MSNEIGKLFQCGVWDVGWLMNACMENVEACALGCMLRIHLTAKVIKDWGFD